MKYRDNPTRMLLTACVTTGLLLGGCQNSNDSRMTDTGGSAGTPGAARPATQSPPPRSGAIDLDVLERSRLREQALSVLENAALSEWALLRANALEGMSNVPTRVEPFVRTGLADENLGVRYSAAMIAGRLRLKETAPLVRPLLRDQDGSVRIAAMYALTRFGESVDLTPVSEALMRGSVRERKVAAFVLGELGERSAVPLLLDASRRLQSSDADVLPATEIRLLRLQIGEALAKLGDESARNAIRAALYPAATEELEASVLAAQILGEIRDADAAAELVRLVTRIAPGTTEHPDPMRRIYLYPKELRLAAARSLAQLGYPDGWYVGLQYARDPQPAVRAQVAFVLSETRRSEDVVILERMLGDEDEIVRVSAAAGLLKVLEGPNRRGR